MAFPHTHRPRPALGLGAIAVVIAAGLALAAGRIPVSAAGPYPDAATGYDISWPQCGNAYPPAGAGVAVVGVDYGHPYNNGMSFNPNPCLSSEWAWASSSPYQPSVYLNTDYPHNGNAGADPYWYGWDGARDAVAYAHAHGINPAIWWLDVETTNWWQTDASNNYLTGANARVIQGNIDYLHSQTLVVGVYSTPYQWNRLVGAYSPGVPVWAADYNDSQPWMGCTSSHAFGGGTVWQVQSAPGTWDPNYSCASEHGYYLVGRDGGIFPYGNAPGYGSLGNLRLNSAIVGITSVPQGGGYWLVAGDGGIFPFGPNAPGYGSTGNIRLNRPIVGMTAAADGRGYWLVATDGGIFPFGPSAPGYGSTGNLRLNQPIVGMAAAPDGHGYWLVASDGGIFPFGPSAPGYGSAAGKSLAPVVGMAATKSGHGYWLVAADGGIFPFGDAPGYGSAAAMNLDATVAGMAVTPSGQGYWVVTKGGSVVGFGDATSQVYGTLRGHPLNAPVLGMAGTP
jgi:hypothetical protein